ncbi:hypothetical protein VH22019_00006 [Vibrio phage VH2_2019]|nr:hypothetical protein VH22019_00006 [Vibrio phage VH2_2019]
MGSTLMIGSGAKDGRKSDAVLDAKGYQFRIESKATKNKSYGLKLETLEKIRKEALDTGRTPMMTISFTNEMGEAVHNGDYVVLPMSLFNEVFND